MKTIAARLDEYNGNTSGFDYLRLFLAFSVILIHAQEVATGENSLLWGSALRSPVTMVLPMFFALSGFLVTASLFRTKNLPVFMGHRIIRIIPALSVEVILSAFILGPFLTSLPLREYLGHPVTFAYLGNIIGHIQYELPGVFDNTPNQYMVNRSLWTIPFELYCYLALAVSSIFTLTRRRILSLCLYTAALLAAIASVLTVFPQSPTEGPPGIFLVFSFLGGCIAYQWKDIIPFSKAFFFISLTCSLILLSLPQLAFAAQPLIVYVTIYAGLQTPARRTFLLKGDYSYGIYLFAYPIQQTIAHLLGSNNTWWINLTLTLPPCIAYAFCSWHLIEKPCLTNRHRIIEAFGKIIGRLWVKKATS